MAECEVDQTLCMDTRNGFACMCKKSNKFKNIGIDLFIKALNPTHIESGIFGILCMNACI